MAQTPVSNAQASLALTEFVDLQGLFPPRDAQAPGPFLGSIGIFAGSPNIFAAPAAGQILGISQNTTLFSLLGTNFGGDGRSTFALPNLDGLEAVGTGAGVGLDPVVIGEQTGEASNTLTRANLPPSAGGTSIPIDNEQPSLGVTYSINPFGSFPSSGGGMDLSSVGVISAFAGNFAPGLPCDGRLLNIADYTALYGVIGTTYGGDGINTFALPDLQGRDIVGAGQDRTGATYSLGEKVGTPTVSLGTANLPSSGDAPIDNQQPGLVLNYYISVKGIFPSSPDVGNTDQTTPFLGQIVAFAGNVQPNGWLPCDGQLLPIDQDQALFALLGTTYGGDGIRTFALPNLQGRTVLGASAFTLGQVSGSNFTALVQANLPPLPTVTAIDIAGTSLTASPTDAFTVTFSQAVGGVTASDFTLAGSGVTGTIGTPSSSDGGTTWTVPVTGVSGNGTLGLNQTSATGIKTVIGGVPLTGTHNSDQTYTIDQTAPTISSIVPAGPNLGKGGAEAFTVTFSEGVTGVASGAFTAVTSGTTDTGIAVTPIDASHYTVTVTGVGGNGALGLDLNSAGTGIKDLAGNAISGGLTGGTYTIDTTPPVVTSITANGALTNNTNSDQFTVTFSKPVTGVTAADFNLTTSNTPGGTALATNGITSITGSGTTYTVTVGGVAGDGTLRLDLKASSTGITDVVGNGAVAGFTSGDSYTIEHTPPAVTSIAATGVSPNNAANETFTVTFSEAVTGLQGGDFAPVNSGTVTETELTVTPVSGSVYTVTAIGVTGDGTLGLAFVHNPQDVTDTAGNVANADFTSGDTYTLRHTPPAVAAMTVPANGTYIVGQNLDFTVTFTEPVIIDTTGGMPRIPITLTTGGTAYATYSSGSSTNTLQFQYVPMSGQQDLTGITLATSIDPNGGTIKDAVGNNAVLAINAVEPSTTGIDVDAIPPVVTSVAVPANGTYIAGQVLTFTVDFSKNVLVATGGGTPTLPITLPTGTVDASYVSGTGTNALTFAYSVLSGETAPNGITVGSSIILNGGSIKDAVTNAATLTLNNVASTTNVDVDTIPPTVTSITTAGANPNNAASETFTVTFSEAVTGVRAGDFAPVNSGTVTETVLTVTPVSGSVYTVTAAGVTGDGTLGLDLDSSGTSIADLATNAINGGFTAGQTYTVDHTAPTLAAMTVPSDGLYGSGQSLSFSTSFSEAVTVTGTPQIAVTLDHGGTVEATYTGSSNNGKTLNFGYQIQPNQEDLTGIVTGTSIDLNGGAIQDAAGNNAALGFASVEPSTTKVLVDALASPTLAGAAYDAASGTLTLTGTSFTDAIGFTPADLTLAGQGGRTYQLTTASSGVSVGSATTASIALDAADQIQVAGLVDQNGGTAQDGTSFYGLTAAAGWDINGQAITTAVPVTASGSFDPTTHIGSATNITSLNALIVAADSAASPASGTTHFEIDLSGAIAVSSGLEAINLKSGVTLDIKGSNGATLDGRNEGAGTSYGQRGLFVYAGTVTIENLTVENMVAKGGTGGSGGGGGAGLGGGLFIGSNVTGDHGAVTLANVAFLNDSATGGRGGAGNVNGSNGGGGGLGGNGTTLIHGSGGGGGGVGSSGGIVPGAQAGGNGGRGGNGPPSPHNTGGAGGAGNPSGGGGGVGGAGGQGTAGGGGTVGAEGGDGGGGGGGVGGANGGSGTAAFFPNGPTSPPTGGNGGHGGNGGFGGGGGGGAPALLGNAGNAGNGGFGGGGGGSQGQSGSGGFGGGGGNAAKGGFGGGKGGVTGGGGGLGAGGDIFVQQGGSLTIVGSGLGTGTVTGGSGASQGAAYGDGLFIQGGTTAAPALVTLGTGQTSGQTTTVAGVVADQDGAYESDHNGALPPAGNSADGTPYQGVGGLVIAGSGTILLAPVDSKGQAVANTYVGGTTIDGGTLELATNTSAGSGAITFGSAAVTLQLDATPTGGSVFGNTLDTVAAGDALDLRGLAYSAGMTASVTGSTLSVKTAGGTTIESFTLANPSATTFLVTQDGAKMPGTLLTAVTAADLALSATVSNATPNVGDTITLTETLTNAGPNAASGVSVADLLPGGLSLVSATPSGGTYVNGVWTVGALGANAADTLVIQAKVTSPNAQTDTASISHADQYDPTIVNDSASVTETPQQADLALSATVSNPTPNVGDTITLTETLTNGGPSAATGVSVADLLPTGLSLVSATPSAGSYANGVWTVGTLGANATATLTFTATVTSPNAQTDTASIGHSDQYDPTIANDSASTTETPQQADLALSATVSNATPNVGDIITLTETLSNGGPSAASGVSVADLLPTGLSLVSATPSGGSSYDANTGTWTVGALGANAAATLTFTATVTSPNAQTDTASIGHSDQYDPTIANDSASVTETPQQADLALSATVSNATPNVGDTITITETLSNGGPNAASGVSVADLLPGGLSLVSATPSAGSYANGVWTVGTLGANAADTLTFTATVTSPNAQTDTASISHADQYDPNAANDTASTTATPAAPPTNSVPTLPAPPSVAFDPTVSFSDPNTATLTGTASDASGIKGVEIFEGTKDLGAATLNGDGAWSFAFDDGPGFHTGLTALATANDGATASTPSSYDLTTGVTGAPYASYQDRYDPATGGFEGQTFFTRRGALEMQTQYSPTPDGGFTVLSSGGAAFAKTPYFALVDTYDAAGQPLEEDVYYKDGQQAVSGLVPHRTLDSILNDTFYSKGGDNSFVFTPHFGADTITSFRLGGPHHDTISLPDNAASRLGAILNHATPDAQGDTTLHLNAQNSITIQGVSDAELKQHRGDFSFHA